MFFGVRLAGLACVFFGPILGLASVEIQGWITNAGDNLPPLSSHPPQIQKNSADLPQDMQDRILLRIEPSQLRQEIIGYGASLTESSVLNFQALSAAAQEQLLQQLFSAKGGAHFSFLRVPMGSSDFSDPDLPDYSYDDSPNNQPDPDLNFFNMGRDQKTIDFLARARRINPDLKIMLTPWSAPAWMKKNGNLLDGSLDPAHWQDYANYLVRVIREFEARGISVHAFSIQNEPGYANSLYPSMGMQPEEQRDFIKQVLGPALKAAGIGAKLLVLDHNWDMAWWVNRVLADSGARAYIDGIAFHCYSGNLQQVQDAVAAFPDSMIYQTECTGWGEAHFEGDLQWWLQNQVVDAANIGARSGLGWNLFLDDVGGPHRGGCADCRGLVVRNSKDNSISFNPEYWALAHASRFLHAGARVAWSETSDSNLHGSAFQNPDGSLVLILTNPSSAVLKVNVEVSGAVGFIDDLPAGAAITYVLNPT